MKTSVQDRLRNIGFAFAVVGVVALVLSLTALAPEQGTNGQAIGAASFVIVGLVMLGIWAVRRR